MARLNISAWALNERATWGARGAGWAMGPLRASPALARQQGRSMPAPGYLRALADSTGGLCHVARQTWPAG